MTLNDTPLWGLPPVLPLESPASWLTRAALSQGIRTVELLRYLRLHRFKDVDLGFVSGSFSMTAALCGLKRDEFSVVRRLFASLHSVDREGDRFLLRTKRGRPRYRVCPCCLRDQPEPYFAIHWRFTVWHFCPEHNCLMEDACWACDAYLEMPASLLSQGPKRHLAAYLSQCLRCGKLLSKAPAVDLTTVESGLSVMDKLLMSNGRAALAALFQRRVILGEHREEALWKLRQIERMGLLGARTRSLSAAAVRGRASAIIQQQFPAEEPSR